MDERERMIVEFYQRYKGFFMKKLLRKLGRLVAEDVLHDAMLKLLKSDKFDPTNKGAKKYMLRCVDNCCHSAIVGTLYRSSDRQHFQNCAGDFEFDFGTHSFENSVLAKIDIDMMLSSLPKKQKNALIERKLLGLEFGEKSKARYNADEGLKRLKQKAKELQP